MNIKTMEKKTKHYQLKNMLIKSDHIHKISSIILKIWYLENSKDTDEERVMHSKSDKIEIMINDEADEFIKELF